MNKTPGVGSARRVLEVLLLFAENGPEQTVEQLVSMTSITPPTMYRYLTLLREMSLIVERGHGTYALAPRAHSFGQAAETSLLRSDAVQPVLQTLSQKTGEIVQIMLRVGDSAVCSNIAEAEAHAVRLSFTLGHRMPLHRGAAAKVLFAAMEDDWCHRYFERIQLDDGERSSILTEIRHIRARGWAHSAAEVDEGIWAAAAPVTRDGQVIAALSTAGPQFRIDEAKALLIHDSVISQARKLSDLISSME